MSALLQDPADRLRFPWKTFTGAIVINKLHEAMNKGRAAIKNWAGTLKDQAESTIPNLFNSAFWNSSPAANEPESIPHLINTTATTGTIGGLDRSTHVSLQNGVYATAQSDIGGEAGLKALSAQIIKYAINARDMVDIIIMGDDNYAALEAYLGTLSRYRQNERLAQLKFRTIQYGNVVISFENASNVKGNAQTMNPKYVYGINSNHFSFYVLKDGNFKWADKFERVGQSLNRALYFFVFCNLGTNLPRAHFVMSNVSNT